MKSIFAENLKKRKEELKLTQGQIANKMGIPKARLGSYLEGRAMPRAKDTPKLIEVFKIDHWPSFLQEKNTD